MKVNKWTLGLAAVGLVSLPAGVLADEATKMNQVWTALSSTTISGYVDTSAVWNMGSPGNANPAAFAYDAGKLSGFNLDVVKLSIAKPLDEAQWAAGYQVDLLYGPNAQALGTTGGSDQFAIQQAYVALRTPVGNGLDFKIGVFNTIVGYESFDANKDPNWTRSYGYTMEPTTHEGILMSYQFNDSFTAQFGIANTFGPVIGSRPDFPPADRAPSYLTYMGSLAYTVPKDTGFLEGSTFYVGLINGLNNQTYTSVYGGSSTSVTIPLTDTHLYAGATMNTPMKDVKVGAAFDYAWLHYNGELGGAATPGWQWNLAGYVSWKMTEKMSLHGRGEYYTRTNPDEVLEPNIVPGTLPPKAVEFTATLQYDLWKNVISRIEWRWDHDATGNEYFGGDTVGTPTRVNQYLLAVNVIYQF
jgi:hypothetical protein